MMTLLRVAIANPDGTERLESVYVDFRRDFTEEQKELVRSRKGFDSWDLHRLAWSALDDAGRRIGSAVPVRSEKWLRVSEPVTPQNIARAVEEDEAALRATPIRAHVGPRSHFATL